MLISQKDILEYNPPFLMRMANSTWQLVENVVLDEKNYCLTIIEKVDGDFTKRIIQLDEAPFYVGVEVWELNYGSTLMTLRHESLTNHPAKHVWQDYVDNSN
jgi:hypothetical protein